MAKRERDSHPLLSQSQLEGHEGTSGPTDTLLQRYPLQREPRVLPACSFSSLVCSTATIHPIKPVFPSIFLPFLFSFFSSQSSASRLALASFVPPFILARVPCPHRPETPMCPVCPCRSPPPSFSFKQLFCPSSRFASGQRCRPRASACLLTV